MDNQVRSPVERAQEVKNIDLTNYIQYDGGKLYKENSRYAHFYCPFHSESEPSFVVYKETNTWCCHGACGVSGDIIDFVQRRRQCQMTEAVEILEQHRGTGAPVAQPVARYKPTVNTATWDMVTRYHKNVSEATPYFQSRGINTDTFEHFMLGARIDFEFTYRFSDGHKATQHNWRYTIPDYVIANKPIVRGIAMRRDDEQCLRIMEGNQALVNAIIEDQLGRGISEERARENVINLMFGPKYMKTPGHKGMIFNARRLLRWTGTTWEKPNLETVIIQESHMDVPVTEQSGFPAVGVKIGSGTRDASREAIFNLDQAIRLRGAFANVAQVFIIPDNNEAGRRYARNMAWALGRGTIVALPQEFEDANAAYLKGALVDHLRGAGIPSILEAFHAK